MTPRVDRRNEFGAALVVMLFALTLIAAVGASLALASMGEAMVAGDFARTEEVRYAAEAGLERAMTDLRALDDWTTLSAGGAMSGLTDGPAIGVRQLPGGVVDLGRVVNLANCGKATICTSEDLAANTTGQRPWSVNNPVWRLFEYAPLTGLLPAGAIRSVVYVVVLLAEGPSRNSENNSVVLRAEAFGARGVHQIIQAVVERPSTPGRPLGVRTQQMIGVR